MKSHWLALGFGVLVLVALIAFIVMDQTAAVADSAKASRPVPAVPSASASPVPVADKPAAIAVQPAAPAVNAARIVTTIDQGWKFHLRDLVGGGAQPDMDDSTWQDVDLPHTWNAQDGQDGGNNYIRTASWYRKRLPIPASYAGKRVFIVFDGANTVTTLYVNGTVIGKHRGGFAAFTFDVTAAVHAGSENVVAAFVDNSLDGNLPPIWGDCTFFGGIYRHVRLIAVDPLHISLSDSGSPGVAVYQRKVSSDSADIEIATQVQDDDDHPRMATLMVTVLSADGVTVGTTEATQSIAAHGSAPVTSRIHLTNPHLWNGRPDPYLYHVDIRISENGIVTDSIRQPLGVRSFRMDPKLGFFLNDRPYDLHGVAMHQDRIDKGWARSDDDQRQDIGLIKDIGATFVRLTHYQHPPLTYDLLDECGIIAWTEIPVLMRTTDSPEFVTSSLQQLTELIKQNINHPSVVCWALYNEIPDQPAQLALVKGLNALAHELDPTRPTTAASYAADTSPINTVTDVITFNKYFGWYYPSIPLFGSWLDACHEAHPAWSMGLTEYGAGASVNQHEESPQERIVTIFKAPRPEEYQSMLHEQVWKQLAARPYLWCKSLWVMFDFAADLRQDAEIPGRNDKGLVTGDRIVKKDAYYFYKATWSNEPVLYVTSRRFINHQTAKTSLKVYSNLDDVTATLNGVALSPANREDRIFRWADVVLRSGANQIQATGTTKDGKSIVDTVTWNAP